MEKLHRIPVTSTVEGAADKTTVALIRKAIRTALTCEGVATPCEVDVLLTYAPGQPPVDDADADPMTGLTPLGDMAISLERVKAQAAEYGHSEKRELCYLVVHSVLHLLGYDHLDEGPQKKQMRAREEAIMATLGVKR